MKIKLLQCFLGAAAVFGTMQAQAYSVSLTTGATSDVPNVATETFQAAPVFARTGGAVFNSDSQGAYLTSDDVWLVPGLSAQPNKGFVSTSDKWFSVAGDETATFSFSAGTTYVGFLWGSVDSYNTVSFYDANSTLIASFSGGEGGLAAHQVSPGYGDQRTSTYFNFSAPSIGSMTLASNSNSFEIDNVSAVPEPETYALMLAGLGAVAFVARRRSR